MIPSFLFVFSTEYTYHNVFESDSGDTRPIRRRRKEEIWRREKHLREGCFSGVWLERCLIIIIAWDLELRPIIVVLLKGFKIRLILLASTLHRTPSINGSLRDIFYTLSKFAKLGFWEQIISVVWHVADHGLYPRLERCLFGAIIDRTQHRLTERLFLAINCSEVT